MERKITTGTGSAAIRKGGLIAFVLLVAFLAGCSVNYSFTGASISPRLETISVQYFQNNAPTSSPTLSQDLTENMQDVFEARTRLTLVSDIGDVNFEGEITDYRTQPVSVGADERASQERLTISVRVRFTNKVDPDNDFERTFSRHADYDADVGLDAVEAQLVEKIIDELIQDIFNYAFVNW